MTLKFNHYVSKSLFFLFLSENILGCWNSIVAELFEKMLSGRDLQNIHWWHSDDIYYQLELFPFICPWEKRKTREEFNHHASYTPHVNTLVVRKQPKHDIRGPIESTLYVSVHNLIIQCPTSKVSYHYSTFILRFEQNIFGFQITVYNANVLQELESREDLDCKPSYKTLLKALVVVHLNEFIQIYTVKVE